MPYKLLSSMPNDIGLAFDMESNSFARWDGTAFVPIGGAGASNHATLINLAFENSGHMGFASQQALNATNAMIPNQASPSNQLATQAFVNSTLQTMSANKVSYDASGNPFPTRDSLDTASVFYFQGNPYTPAQHDYCTVLSDETQGGAQCRYAYDGALWVFQFLVNDTPFTAAQNEAINSGVSAPMVSLISNLLGNIDVAPAQGSNNLVLSGGVFSALAYKQKLLNYATSEQATGRNDESGNPTYEITVIGQTGASGTWNNVGAAIPGFASLVNIVRGVTKNTTGSFIPHGTISAGLQFALTVSSSGQIQEEHTGAPLNNQQVIATVEYTKS